MTHALQADQLGLKGKTGKIKKILGDYISSRFKDMPDFDAEGFSDWTAEHLGNFSFWDYREQKLTDAYETSIDQLAKEAGIELENERQRKGLQLPCPATGQLHQENIGPRDRYIKFASQKPSHESIQG
jgi:hypothetical protein